MSWLRLIIMAALSLLLAGADAARATDRYVKPSATGTGDGTSWANASAWATAAALATTGDVIYTDAPTGAPFVGEMELSTKTGVTIVTNAGPSGVSYLDNRRTANVTDAGSGVFTLALAAPPGAVLYDAKQDDLAGTVTGVAISAWQQMLLALWGVDPSEARAWYGFVKRDGLLSGVAWTLQDSSPSDGTWTWTGGTLYVNPPGSPVEATVESLLRYCPDDLQGWELEGCDDCHLRGLSYVMFYAGYGNADVGGNGYGYAAFGNNARNCSIAGVHAVCSGWHGVGFAGANSGGPNNTIRDCVVNGCASNNSATSYVFYQPSSQSATFGGHVGRDLVALLTPPLDTTGKPLPPESSATLAWGLTAYLSHSTSAPVETNYRGIQWRRCLTIDFSDMLEAKHTITNASVGELAQHVNGTVATPSDPTSYPVQCSDSAAVGRMFADANSQVAYRRCLFDRDGCGRADLGSAGIISAGASNALNLSLRDCTLISGNYPADAVSNVTSDANDYLWLKDCRIYLQGSTANRAFAEFDPSTPTDRCYLAGTIIQSDGAVARAAFRGNDAHSTPATIFDSGGGNAFGTGLTTIIWNNAASSTRDITYWAANVPGASTDVQQAPAWGGAPEDVLRMLWLESALRRAAFASSSLSN